MSQVVEASLISYIFSKIYKTIININIKHYYYPRKKKNTIFFFLRSKENINIIIKKAQNQKLYSEYGVFLYFLFLRYGLNFQLYFNFFVVVFVFGIFVFIYFLFIIYDVGSSANQRKTFVYIDTRMYVVHTSKFFYTK